jgi:hypothetical protein
VRSCEIHTSTDAPGDETRLDELGRRQDQKLAELQSWQPFCLAAKALDWKKLLRYSLKFPQSVRSALEAAAA